MLKFTFVVFGLFCTTAGIIQVGKHTGKDKSVNLALETVFEFDETDQKSDVNLLNKVQKFIGKMKSVIENNNVGRRHLSVKNKNIFTNLVINSIRVLNKYEDHDLEQFIFIVIDEIKHSELKYLLNNKIQGVIATKLDELTKIPLPFVRYIMTEVVNKIEEEKYIKSEKALIDTINSMYTADLAQEVNKFVTNLDEYRLKSRKSLDLSKIVSKGLANLVFKPFANISTQPLLMAKVQDLVKHLHFDGWDNITDSENAATTETTEGARTLRQLYLERDLNKQWNIGRTNIKRKTYMYTTKRPHRMPPTLKLQSDKEEDEFNSDEKDKSTDISENSVDNKSHKSRTSRTETTRDAITMRQMYVEKNIDLKYDPDAYVNLTTQRSDRTKTGTNSRQYYYPTTYKHTKKTYQTEKVDSSKELDMSTDEDEDKVEHSFDESDKDNRKNNKGKIIKDLMIQLSTEVHLPTKGQTVKQTAAEEYIASTPLNDDKNRIFRSKPLKIWTFQPLHARMGKYRTQKMPRRIVNIREHRLRPIPWEDRPFRRPKPWLKPWPKNHGTIQVVKDRSMEMARGSREQQAFYDVSDVSRRKSEIDDSSYSGYEYEKTTRRYQEAPMFRNQHRYNRNLRVSRDPMMLAQRMRVSHAKHYRSPYYMKRFQRSRPNWNRPNYKYGNGMGFRVFNRRKEINPYAVITETTNTTEANITTETKHPSDLLLNRLKQLENELALVKTQIKNDTNINGTTKNNSSAEMVTEREKNNDDIFKTEIPNNYMRNKNVVNKELTNDLTQDDKLLKSNKISYRSGPYENQIVNTSVKEYLKKFKNTLELEDIYSNEIIKNISRKHIENYIDVKKKSNSDAINKSNNETSDIDKYPQASYRERQEKSTKEPINTTLQRFRASDDLLDIINTTNENGAVELKKADAPKSFKPISITSGPNLVSQLIKEIGVHLTEKTDRDNAVTKREDPKDLKMEVNKVVSVNLKNVTRDKDIVIIQKV